MAAMCVLPQNSQFLCKSVVVAVSVKISFHVDLFISERVTLIESSHCLFAFLWFYP